MKRFTRRSFLAFLSLLPATGLAKAKPRNQDLDTLGPSLPQQRQQLLESIIGPYQSIVEVGKQVSLQHEYSPWLRHFTHNIDAVLNSAGIEEIKGLRDVYRRRVMADFQLGRTSRVNGYVLSQTEVETCHWAATLISNQ